MNAETVLFGGSLEKHHVASIQLDSDQESTDGEETSSWVCPTDRYRNMFNRQACGNPTEPQYSRQNMPAKGLTCLPGIFALVLFSSSFRFSAALSIET